MRLQILSLYVLLGLVAQGVSALFSGVSAREAKLLQHFRLKETNPNNEMRLIYLHRAPLMQTSIRAEVLSHEAVQVGDVIHDFGNDGDDKIGYSALRFGQWAKWYPAGQLCSVGETDMRDGQILEQALSHVELDYTVLVQNCHVVSRVLIDEIAYGQAYYPIAPVIGLLDRFNRLIQRPGAYDGHGQSTVVGGLIMLTYHLAVDAVVALVQPDDGILVGHVTKWEKRKGTKLVTSSKSWFSFGSPSLGSSSRGSPSRKSSSRSSRWGEL